VELNEFEEAVGILQGVAASGSSLHVKLTRTSEVNFVVEFNSNQECERTRISLASLIGNDVGIFRVSDSTVPIRIRIIKRGEEKDEKNSFVLRHLSMSAVAEAPTSSDMTTECPRGDKP